MNLDIFQKEINLEIMCSNIDTKASIMEISFIMVTQGSTRLYVVENKKYYGTIFRSDIIKKVLHI